MVVLIADVHVNVCVRLAAVIVHVGVDFDASFALGSARRADPENYQHDGDWRFHPRQ